MPVERSAGAVIFRKEKDNLLFLLLHYPSSSKSPKNYWDFPKGHIEGKESIEQTARREAEEETGLKDLEFIEGFREWMKYFFKSEGKTIFKIVTYLLAETKTKKVEISFEHTGFKWLSFQEALEQLTFKNAKDILRKANGFLNKQAK
jgi:bis(5'-nucleosidyl)-tetraphosphatase